jgi:hypothetical protein
MNDIQYHSDKRIGRSGLHDVSKSPYHYWAKYLDPARVWSGSTDAMRLGTAVHTLILEPDTFGDKIVVEPEFESKARAGVSIAAQRAAFAEQHARKTTITADQLALGIAMRDAVRRHPAARLLLARGVAERTVLFDHPLTGSPSKAKPDWDSVEHNGLIVDLKTARDASPAAFARACVDHWYHVQTAWYLDAHMAETGEWPKGFVFIVVENAPPHAVAVYYAPPEMINLGRRIYEPVLETYEACRQSGTWPAYGDDIKPLTLPAWAFR